MSVLTSIANPIPSVEGPAGHQRGKVHTARHLDIDAWKLKRLLRSWENRRDATTVCSSLFESMFRYGLNEALDLVGEVGYADVEVDPRFGDLDDNRPYHLSGGLRWMATDRVELNGKVSYVHLDDAGSDTTFQIGGLFHSTADLAVGASAEFGDDANTCNLGIRYYVGSR